MCMYSYNLFKMCQVFYQHQCLKHLETHIIFQAMRIFYSSAFFYSWVDRFKNTALPFEKLHNLQYTERRVDLPVVFRDWLNSRYKPHQQGSLCGMGCWHSPYLRGKEDSRALQEVPQRSDFPRCYGNCFSQKKPRMTVSELKKKKRKKDTLFASQVHKFAYFLTCNGKMFVEVRSTHFPWKRGSTSWKSKWCHFFPTCTEVWTNYLLQWPGGNVPCSAQKGTIDLEKCNRNVPVSFTNSWLQNNCFSLSNTLPDHLVCPVSQASPSLVENLSWPIYDAYFISSLTLVHNTQLFVQFYWDRIDIQHWISLRHTVYRLTYIYPRITTINLANIHISYKYHRKKNSIFACHKNSGFILLTFIHIIHQC